MTSLAKHLGEGYGGYAYAYPHKTAYRPLAPRSLREVWAEEAKGHLFLYLHVPFCEMRCGFCNLFTYVGSRGDEHRAYVDAVARQAAAAAEALGPERRFARLAVGGGTPTFLPAAELDRLMAVAGDLGAADVPTSVEVSPVTADDDRLAVLRARGVDRISIGIQSFVEDECRALGRPQRLADAMAALRRIRAQDFPVLNLDLIYGAEGQTEASWRFSLARAVELAPEEIYLYPLYVRPLTGLGRRDRSPHERRRSLYRQGRDHLRAAGYEQVSMRMFRRGAVLEGPVYCCQRDGMIGLGAGARSYSRRLHYSSEYAVARRGVKGIVGDFVERPRHDQVDYGIELDDDERARRFVLQSLLQREGLDAGAFEAEFGAAPRAVLPQLDELFAEGLATEDEGRVILNDAGLEASDAIGPWLTSPAMERRMKGFALR